ncbi:MAG: hypothetical protein JKP90_17095 [Desulfofustis sp. PB-SRB1]|nr:hypothetical protein [Desulfofustis sp. PB-SRB1]
MVFAAKLNVLSNYMKTKLLFIAFVTLFAISVSAEIVTLDEGKITFEAPDEFKPVPQEIIDVKYPSSRAPKYVIGNESASTTIAYDLKPHNIPQDKIEEAKAVFVQMFPRMIPGLEWKENKVVTLSGRKWGYLEMTSHAIDTDIYNIMLFTGYKGQMLIFNFNSTKEEFPKYEKVLRESLKSISIKE